MQVASGCIILPICPATRTKAVLDELTTSFQRMSRHICWTFLFPHINQKLRNPAPLQPTTEKWRCSGWNVCQIQFYFGSRECWVIDNAYFLNEGNKFFSAEYQQVSKVLTLRHCLYWENNPISKELRPTTAIIRFLFCVKVGRPEKVVYSSTKLGQNSKKKDNLGFVVTPYGIKEKKTIHSLAHFPHYYHYPGPFFLTITTRFCDKRNCFVTRHTFSIWCHKVPPLS